MKRRKLIALLLTASIGAMLALTACGGGGAESTPRSQRPR